MNPVVLMVAARFASLGISLMGIPLLLWALGLQGFSLWALLLGISAFCQLAEASVAQTGVRFLSARPDGWAVEHASVILSNLLLLLLLANALVAALIFGSAGWLAGLLSLPDGQWLKAEQLVQWVAIAAALYGWTRPLQWVFHAAGHFHRSARLSVLVPLLINGSAWVAAVGTRSVEITVISYWLASLLVGAGLWLYSQQRLGWRFNWRLLNWSQQRTLLKHSGFLQLNDISHFLQFHFDKFLLATVVGVLPVAHYEISSKVAQALKSLPMAGMTTFLPDLSRALAGDAGDSRKNSEQHQQAFLHTMRVAMHGAVALVLIPTMLAPVALFSWAGQIGYHSRYMMLWLGLGAAVSLLMVPISLCAQALGRTDWDARMAGMCALLNAGLSVLFIYHFGQAGVAAGTAISLSASTVLYLWYFHHQMQWRLRCTVLALVRWFWPVLLVAVGVYGVEWCVRPWVIESRWLMAPATVVLYGVAILSLLLVYRLTNAITAAEFALFRRKMAGWLKRWRANQ